MATKFSQFTTGATLADIDYFVGYQGTDNVQIPKALLTGTTYSVVVPAATTNINLAGSDGTNDAITLTAGTDISLTRVSDSEISIASTATGDTYTFQAGAKVGSSVPLQLDAAAGTDSSVNLTEGAGISLTQNSATEITVAATGSGGDTYDLNSSTNASNVDLNLTSGSGTDNSTVLFTAGTNMTITQSAGNNITFAASGSAGVTITKDQFTGNNSTTAFTLSVTPTSADNLNIFISGVYQNSVDSSGTANYSVAGTTLTFVTAPPTTATNGIEVVITE
jgi:hypothetical protein